MRGRVGTRTAPPAEVVIASEVEDAPVKSARRRHTCGWGWGLGVRDLGGGVESMPGGGCGYKSLVVGVEQYLALSLTHTNSLSRSLSLSLSSSLSRSLSLALFLSLSLSLSHTH